MLKTEDLFVAAGFTTGYPADPILEEMLTPGVDGGDHILTSDWPIDPPEWSDIQETLDALDDGDLDAVAQGLESALGVSAARGALLETVFAALSVTSEGPFEMLQTVGAVLDQITTAATQADIYLAKSPEDLVAHHSSTKESS